MEPEHVLIAAMGGVLVWIIKAQWKTIHNHLSHMQSSIDRLPCVDPEECPVED